MFAKHFKDKMLPPLQVSLIIEQVKINIAFLKFWKGLPSAVQLSNFFMLEFKIWTTYPCIKIEFFF